MKPKISSDDFIPGNLYEIHFSNTSIDAYTTPVIYSKCSGIFQGIFRKLENDEFWENRISLEFEVTKVIHNTHTFPSGKRVILYLREIDESFLIPLNSSASFQSDWEKLQIFRSQLPRFIKLSNKEVK